MGFYAAQWVFNHLPSGLKIAQVCIMQRAAWSCFDDIAFLDRSKAWLAQKCGMGFRTAERNISKLAKLNMLVEGDGGFRLPRFYEYHRQNGGICQSLTDDFFASDKLAAILAEKKERTKERKEQGMNPGEAIARAPAFVDKFELKRQAQQRFMAIDEAPMQDFSLFYCELCPVAHEWRVEGQPSELDSFERVACPEYRSRLKSTEVKA